MDASVTNSSRRVRTRTHGGVAGVGGWPPPLCRSDVQSGTNSSGLVPINAPCGHWRVNTGLST